VNLPRKDKFATPNIGDRGNQVGLLSSTTAGAGPRHRSEVDDIRAWSDVHANHLAHSTIERAHG